MWSLTCLSVFRERFMKICFWKVLYFVFLLSNVKLLLVSLSLDNAICKQKKSASIFEMFLVCFFTFKSECFPCQSVFGERSMRNFHLSVCLSLKNTEWKWTKFCLLYLSFLSVFFHISNVELLLVCLSLENAIWKNSLCFWNVLLFVFSLCNVKLLLDYLSLDNAIWKEKTAIIFKCAALAFVCLSLKNAKCKKISVLFLKLLTIFSHL
jgi:hypothetical protein